MATFHNCSKGWLRSRAFRPYLILFGLTLFAVFITILLFWHAAATKNFLGFLLVLWLVLYIIRKTKYLGKRIVRQTLSYRLGWIGELIVGIMLKQLPEDTHVFYDVRIHDDSGNTDYVVVSPWGIFTIEVKNHRGKLLWWKWVHKEYGQSKSEARQLHQDLAQHGVDVGWINPVLVRADLFLMQAERQEKVISVGLFALNKLLRGEYERVGYTRLTPDQIRDVVATIENLAKCKTHRVRAS